MNDMAEPHSSSRVRERSRSRHFAGRGGIEALV
jgi:hypothetical protein